MHWTAMLRDQTLPPDARVGRELPCVGCGYNLYRADPRGKCPECAGPVRDSIEAATRPLELAADFRRLAPTLVSFVVLGVLLFAPRSGLSFIAVIVLMLGAISRLIVIIHLRRAGRLRIVPASEGWLGRLLVLANIELGILFALLLAIFAPAPTAGPTAGFDVEKIFGMFVWAWILCAFAQLLVLGMLGRDLARRFGYAILRWESTGLLISLLLVPVLALLLGVLGAIVSGSMNVAVRIVQIALIVAGGPLLLTMIIHLLHLANAADRIREREEDLLEAIGE